MLTIQLYSLMVAEILLVRGDHCVEDYYGWYSYKALWHWLWRLQAYKYTL